MKANISALARKGFEPNSAAGFLFGIGCIAVATLVRAALGMWFGATLYFVAFFPAVALTALFAGFWPGMLALGLSVALGISFFIPGNVLASLSPSFFANLAIYLFAGFITVLLGHLFRSAVRELQAEQAQRELILKEVEHRSRNMGALGAAIVHYSLKDNREAAELINRRMKALQDTNNLITLAPELQPDIQTIIKQELAPFGTGRYTLDGGALKLRADVARAVGLIVHELVTNAVKYGALSEDNGKLTVRWRRSGNEITIEWEEHKNTPIPAPSRVGFGTQLIEATVKGMNGCAERTFGERSYLCRIVLRP